MSKKKDAGAVVAGEEQGGGTATLVAELVPSDVRKFAQFAPNALEPDPRNPRGPVTMESVAEDLLGKRFNLLGKATWDLADGTLLPKAGPCVTCPKTSLRAPGLFDDGDADPESPKALKEAVCRDTVCWQAKCDAVQKKAIADLRKENPGAPVVRKTYDHVAAPKGVPVKALGYGDTVAAKPSKGSSPAILLGENGPELVHVKERKKPKPAVDPKKAPAKGEDPKKALAASKKEIADRRAEWILDELAKQVEGAPFPQKATVAQGVIAAYGFFPDVDAFEDDTLEQRKKAFAAGGKGLLESIWPRACERAADEANAYGGRGKKTGDELRWLAEVLEFDVAGIEARAVAEIPDPKWWGKAEASAEKTLCEQLGHAPLIVHLLSIVGSDACCGAKVAQKRGASLVSTAVESDVTCGKCMDWSNRVCRGCNKTAKKIALDGLDWKDTTLCTACGGAQPRGKKKAKKGGAS